MIDHEEYAHTLKSFRLAAVVTVAVLAGGMVFYHHVEDLSWVDALYFCTVTLTTIGYGDIVPQTTAGKIFTVFYVFMGVGIIAAFANLALKRAVMRRKYHDDSTLTRKPAKKDHIKIWTE